MNGSTSFRLVLIVALNFLLDSPANAGVVKRSLRMVREVYPPDVDQENEGNQPPVCIVGDVVYGVDETVPAEQPCLKCRCQPPGVQCETLQCTKKPGCKAIHRPNRCCPDYQCECEHNGHIYANGEKLASTPGGECKVCYCRGGEVQCTEVSCYIRNDCEGKRVPGTCCPKYDHCPPIDFDRSSSTEPTLNTLRPVGLEEWQDSNTSTTAILPQPLVLEEINKVPVDRILTPIFEEVPLKEESLQHKITIQEIIPERKEIPITAPPKIFISEPQGTLLIEEAIPTSEYASNDLGIDSEPESSEVSEVFQHPPPVLRIGDKLLFLKKGNLVPEKDVTTPDSVITIIGAEGLQRGGVEESLEVHEQKMDLEPLSPETKINDNLSVLTTSSEGSKPPPQEQETEPLNANPDGDRLLSQNTTDIPKVLSDSNGTSDTNDLELKVSESTHILSLVKRKDKTTSSSTTPSTTTQPEISANLTNITVAEVLNNQSINNYSREMEKSASDTSSTHSTPIETTTEGITKITEPLVEQNPAYPPLPDIMPAGGENHQKADLEVESSTKQTKIFLPEVSQFLSNKTENETHSQWLKTDINPVRNDSLKFFTAASLPDELLNQKSPIDEVQEINIDANTDTTIASITEANVKGAEFSNFEKVEEIIVSGNDAPTATSTETSLKELPVPTIENPKNETLIKEGSQLIAEVNITDQATTIQPPTISAISEAITNEAAGAKITGEAKDKKISLEAKSSEDEIDCVRNDTSVGPVGSRSVESVEIDSGEFTTPKTNHSSMVSAETASVENLQEEANLTSAKSPLESIDLVQTASKEVGIELSSLETIDSTPESILKDVEMVNENGKGLAVESTSEVNAMKHDVELIDVVNTPKPTKLSKIETSTYELLPTPEETQSRSILKREASSQDDVFKDLEKELNSESDTSHKTPEEEQLEADQIFKELTLETEKGNTDTRVKSPDQEKSDKLSKLVADVALKGKFPDINALRHLGLFGNQRK